MKAMFLLMVTAVSLTCVAQMTMAEKELRKSANFNAFIKEVKQNSRTGCLCTTNEFPVYSFAVTGNKIASLCIAKNTSEKAGYLIYRFGSKSKTELAFPGDSLNSFSQFSFAHYNRGGGKQNAAMYVNILRFSNGGFEYTLRDDWNSEDNRYSKGLEVSNNTKSRSHTAKGKVTGSLWVFVNRNLVPESDEL
jgi:hypothetical protein